MAITAAQVKELRERTASGMMECKKALVEAGGDMDAAAEALRKSGMAKADKKAGRIAAEGLIVVETSADEKTAAIVEVNCETDFVARTPEFQELAHEIALQIAAMSPQWISDEQVPGEIIETKQNIAKKRALDEGKPENVIDRIVEGRVNKFLDETCLLRQEYIRDESKSVDELIKETIASIGENISVRRFVRWEVGEETE